jgi:ribosome-binding protein aMBF1 (putative translation factor)
MDHQQWEPVILTKKNPNANKVTTTVPKTHINNNQTAIKTEKIYDPNKPEADPEIRPVMINSEFGKKISEARCARKLNQKQLAAALCIPAHVINEYERGQGVHNVAYVNKIKTYLGLHK